MDSAEDNTMLNNEEEAVIAVPNEELSAEKAAEQEEEEAEEEREYEKMEKILNSGDDQGMRCSICFASYLTMFS